MPKGKRNARKSRPQQSASDGEEANLREAIRQSLEQPMDTSADALARREEEDLRRAISESLLSSSSVAAATSAMASAIASNSPAAATVSTTAIASAMASAIASAATSVVSSVIGQVKSMTSPQQPRTQQPPAIPMGLGLGPSTSRRNAPRRSARRRQQPPMEHGEAEAVAVEPEPEVPVACCGRESPEVSSTHDDPDDPSWAGGDGPSGASGTMLSQSQVNERMRRMFEQSLRLHANGEYMQACSAITTKLYPHQMFALAWMANRENTEYHGTHGGILADDMGLGKTLSILALILTNFHDGRPLARPEHGVRRRYCKGTAKYLPRSCGGLSGRTHREEVVPSGQKKKPAHAVSLAKIFGAAKSEPNEEEEFAAGRKQKKRSTLFGKLKELSSSSEEEEGEFDSMCNGSSLTCDSDLLEKVEPRFNDGLSDDDEYMNMTEQERNEKMKPRLNVDGACDEEEKGEKSKRVRTESCDSTSSMPEPKIARRTEPDDLPDLDDVIIPGTPEQPNLSLPITSPHHAAPELTESQRKNMRIPPSRPAILDGRRRSTLIVTPASLLSHWLEQIERHVDPRVNIKVFVHHGPSKALIGSELEDHDIVLTTYHTLASEFSSTTHSPLLRAKWLRVCLDEGHHIKNHRTKMARGAHNLDVQRKWIISGTPIQNNLTELWCLLYWLDFEPYASNRPEFKHQIEVPVKYGHPHALDRLQTLMQAVCLRRTKADEINGQPLVTLPKKVVTTREIEFTEDERTVYNAYQEEGKKLIMKYMRHGNLLRNYAHVFAVMMRLRQLCCHREMLPVNWSEVDMNELAAFAVQAIDPSGSEEMDCEEATRLAEQLRQMIREGMSDECSICLSEFNTPVITPCAHVYCRPCITQHLENAPNATCPLCRGQIDVKGLQEAAPDEEEEGKSDPFEDIEINVSSSKVNAVLKELARIKRDFPGDKVIIVSQFTSLLSIIQPLLASDGTTFTRLDGSMNTQQRSAVISDFQDPAPNSPKVLLLSLRAGGVGLNLTAASHLILLDPAWNPSTEEQCFDRIHRLGQTKDVEIIKLIMKDSIEIQMLRIQDKKKNLISGAFRQTEAERRNQRIEDIRTIFGI